MQKSKTAQKGAGKQRPGTEQVRSGTHLQREEGENLQAPKSGQQNVKQEQGKSKQEIKRNR